MLLMQHYIYIYHSRSDQAQSALHFIHMKYPIPIRKSYQVETGSANIW